MVLLRILMTKVSVLSLVVLAIGTARPAEATTMTARNLMRQLVLASENGSGYNRMLFSNDDWRDLNGDCQDTRAEVLISESRVPVTFTSSSHCYVRTGRWYSWYDGRTWTAASDVDIDHVVALKEAWDSGARRWSATNRMRYYNDLGHTWTLDAITDNVNSSKGARDPAEWLPPLKSARCSYAIHWVVIKYRWRLTVNPAEKNKLASLLSGTCGDRVVNVPARAI